MAEPLLEEAGIPIAWHGSVVMVEAKWTDKDGSLVRLKLLDASEEERNPFVRFTKRKGGRAGTRFKAAICELEPPHTPIYTDEAMLAGWNDSQNGGMSVTLWLAHDRMGHPFEGVSRSTKLQLVLVEIDDDEEAIDQKARARVEKAHRPPSERPSYAAAMLCKNPDFWYWIGNHADPYQVIGSEAEAAEWLRACLDISSRGELDRDDAKAMQFRKRIQFRFSEWLSRHTKATFGSYVVPSPATHQ